MKLLEATDILREIVVECPRLNGQNFLVMIPEPTLAAVSKGYEIIIRQKKALIDKKTDLILHAIASEHHLRILEAKNTIALYTSTEVL